MKKKIGILGSTGSVGKTTVSIIENNIKDFQVIFLSSNTNIKKLYDQSIKLKPKAVIIFDQKMFLKYRKKFLSKNIKTFNSLKSLKSSIIKNKIDYVMCAISGLNGLDSTINSINITKNIAIANKESIVCAWSIIEKKLKNSKTNFIPVDSEHFSIWSLLKNDSVNSVDKVFITASGGPFLNYSVNKLKYVSPQQATNHPNWNMGKKISIDSATLMNKVFEVIEAQRIFNIDIKKFKIIIHPNSYIHSIVKLINGQIKILAHETDMKIPIFNSIYRDQTKKINSKNVDLNLLNKLNFTSVDLKKFPSLNFLKNIRNQNTLYETVLISANDELVDLFIKKKIKYLDIHHNLKRILNMKIFSKLLNQKPRHIKEILNLSKEVRLKTKNLCIK